MTSPKTPSGWATEKNHFSSEAYVQDFALSIAKCRDEGYYFVPLIGAGLSVPSGIPQAAALTRYLSWCFLRILGIDSLAKIDADAPAGKKEKWTPRSGVWFDIARKMGNKPKSLSTTDMDQTLKDAIKDLENDGKIEESKGFSAELVREVYGALADWRTALQLMSRIDLVRQSEIPPEGQENVILTARDQSVVDSFFQFHMEGRQPCQGHRMIAALAPVLRMNVILTPNFDNLIECAFAAINSPLKCFEIPHGVPLPDPRLVNRQRSIVKLHGGSFGLRADYSIDEVPDLNDSVKFLSYLAGRPLRRVDLEDGNKNYPDKVALILCGISGKDQRIMAMLKKAQNHFLHLKIFWFCYTDRDVSAISHRFKDDKDNIVVVKEPIDKNARIMTVRHIDYGALLHQIYQYCTNSVPSAGIYFPAAWHMPSAPRIPPPITKRFEKLANKLRQEIFIQINLTRTARKPILIPFYNGARGGVTLLSWLFWNCFQSTGQRRDLRTPVYPLWLDLDDVATSAGVFLRLALALARRAGTANPISHLSVEDFYDRRNRKNQHNFRDMLVRAFRDYHARTGECLLIFINAQETLGSISPFKAEPWQKTRNSISPIDKYSWFSGRHIKENINLLMDLLAQINKDPANGVQFVLVTRQPSEKELAAGMKTVFGMLECKARGRKSIFKKLPKQNINRRLTQFNPAVVAAQAVEYFIPPKSGDILSNLKRPFLHLVIGFRFAAFEASVIRIMEHIASEQPSKKKINIDDLASEIHSWLNRLSKEGVIRWKVGGVIWIKGAVKKEIQKLLRKDRNADNILIIESLRARWYGRLLLATSDPLAATESAYHAFYGIHQWLTNFKNEHELHSNEESLQRLVPMIRHAHGVLNTASTVLEEQLSDQFADYTLILTEASVDAVLRMYKTLSGRKKSKLPQEFEECLNVCRNDIISLRISLYLKEGKFLTLIEFSSPKNGDIANSFRGEKRASFKIEMANLDVATARCCFMDYEGCEKAFRNLWRDIVGIDIAKKYLFTKSGFKVARQWIANQCQTTDGQYNLEVLNLDDRLRLISRLCHRHIYLRLLQSLISRLRRDRTPKQCVKERREYLKQAQWMGDFGVEVLRSIHSTDDHFSFYENVRIRAHSALARATLGFSKSTNKLRKSEFHAALTILNDSEAFIEEFPLRDGKLERVIVELRRAEILLINSGEGRWFGDFRSLLEKSAGHYKIGKNPRYRLEGYTWAEQRIANIRKTYFPQKSKGAQADLHERIAIIYDAMRYLERCERELGNHPKSRWWWWLCLVLQMHAAEGLFALRLMLPAQKRDKREKIIPPSVFKYVNDLDQWVKHVAMNDVFQLARIVRSYRRFLLIQQFYFLSDRDKEVKIETLNQNSGDLRPVPGMMNYERVFKYLSSELVDAWKIRKKVNVSIDEGLRNFVEECIRDAQNINVSIGQRC